MPPFEFNHSGSIVVIGAVEAVENEIRFPSDCGRREATSKALWETCGKTVLSKGRLSKRSVRSSIIVGSHVSFRSRPPRASAAIARVKRDHSSISGGHWWLRMESPSSSRR